MRDAFHDQPGLRLTLAQAARLWSLDQRSCARVLHSLVSMGILVKTPDDRYCRVDQSTSYE